MKSKLYATPLAVEEAHSANEWVVSDLWRNDPAMAASFERLVQRFSKLNALYLGGTLLLVILTIRIGSLESVAGQLLCWTLAAWTLPQIATRFLLRGRGYSLLGAQSRYVIFLTVASHLRKLPHRNELLTIPGLGEDAKSIFFVLGYWRRSGE